MVGKSKLEPASMEVPIRGSSIRGGTGRADIVNKETNRVWEVKPDNENWNKGQGAAQLQRYITASHIYNQNGKVGRLLTGHIIPTFTFTTIDNKDITVRSGGGSEIEEGMIYYSVSTERKEQEERQMEVERQRQLQDSLENMIPVIEDEYESPGALEVGAGLSYIIYEGLKLFFRIWFPALP